MRISLLIVLTLLMVPIGFSTNITLKSGDVYYAFIQGSVPTERWFGLEIKYTNDSFCTSINFNESKVYNVDFKDGVATIILPKDVSFDISKLKSVNQNDLDKNQLFSQSEFPIFYPNYSEYYDNPKDTFCCNLVGIRIGNKKFNAFEIELNDGKEYLADYSGYPAFILFRSKIAILPVNTSYFIYTVAYKEKPEVFHIYPTPCFNYLIIGNTTEVPMLFYVYYKDKGLEGVNINIYQNSSLVVSGLTDKNGFWSYKFNNSGEYKVIFHKNGYCYKDVKIVIFSPPVYSIKLSHKLVIVDRPICFSVYKNNNLTKANIFLLYPNKSIMKMKVNGTDCIVPKSPGKYFLILSKDTKVSTSFVAFEIPHRNFIFPIIVTWRFIYLIVESLIIGVAAIVSFIIFSLRVINKNRFKPI